MRQSLTHDLFHFGPFAIGFGHPLFDAEVQDGAMAQGGRGQAIQKMLLGLARQSKPLRRVQGLQAVQPIAHLVFGLLQGPFLLQCQVLFRRNPLVGGIQQGVTQRLALHGHQDPQGRSVLAHATHRTGALGAPSLQIAPF